MDKIVSKIAALGVPGLVFLFAVGATGLVGAASITTALAALGPGGMIGGIATLGIMGLISEAITEYGFDAIFKAVVVELYKRGEDSKSLFMKIDKYPVSTELKLKLKEKIKLLEKEQLKDEN